jgi:hypothetical protein
MTHTASLAGSAAAGSALLRRLGIIEVQTIAVFLETLKLLHAVGPLPGASIASVSCSGGEASLMADLQRHDATGFRRFRTRPAGGTESRAWTDRHHRQSARLSHLHLG